MITTGPFNPHAPRTTPGPWSKTPEGTQHDYLILDRDGKDICGITVSGRLNLREALGNVDMIVAAPELLEALEKLIAARDSNLLGEANWDVLFDKGRKAIRAAKGE